MDDTELALLYSGYGYQVRFVEYVPEGPAKMGGGDPADKTIHLNMATSIDWAYAEIRKIQKAARSGKPIDKPRWPLIILRSPKGWTGPLSEHGKQLLNRCVSLHLDSRVTLTDSLVSLSATPRIKCLYPPPARTTASSLTSKSGSTRTSPRKCLARKPSRTPTLPSSRTSSRLACLATSSAGSDSSRRRTMSTSLSSSAIGRSSATKREERRSGAFHWLPLSRHQSWS